jgi:hypothetical protein
MNTEEKLAKLDGFCEAVTKGKYGFTDEGKDTMKKFLQYFSVQEIQFAMSFGAEEIKFETQEDFKRMLDSMCSRLWLIFFDKNQKKKEE